MSDRETLEYRRAMTRGSHKMMDDLFDTIDALQKQVADHQAILDEVLNLLLARQDS